MSKDAIMSGLIAQLGSAEPPPARSASGRLAEALRQRIISLDLPPDTVLTRAELAAEYGVSQTPLRDALQKLEAEGLVQVFPQSRTVVTRIDPGKIEEAMFLRLAVEVECVRTLAENPDAAALDRLQAVVSMQKSSAEAVDAGTFQDLDEAFHRLLITALGYPDLHRLIRARSGHLNRLRRLDAWDSAKMARILREHGEILAALRAADPEAAARAMRLHLGSTTRRLRGLKDSRPDYFS